MTIEGTIIVTGGASGLGAAVADAIQKTGAAAVVFDRMEPPSGADHEIVDLSDTERTEEAVRRVAERGDLSAVVTCAGTDSCGPLADVPRDDWERVVRVNLLGTAAVVRAALPALERSRGRIVTVASTLGLRALPDATAYSASKFGVIGFTRALAAEMGGRVGVTCLIPGGMATAFFDERPEKYRPAPDQNLASPSDVADAVVFALQQPRGLDVRELLIMPADEPSWP
ncbi:MAG TPA: SDR family oxidoreductase [Actinomycetota bacterium]|nr:SDR family oxidoreductase [Actinomycetota bacterium]